MSDSANIARHLPLMAARQPDHPAVRVPRGRDRSGDIDYLSLSFAELDTEVNAWAAKLVARGVRRGDRVLVMVRQGLPLIASAFALFKLGAVPVIIDPGMGRKSFLTCVARSRPRVLLGIPLAQLTSFVFRSAFASVGIRIWVPGSPTARLTIGGPVSPPAAVGRETDPPVGKTWDVAQADLAAILFTSGSTGAPKGVCYEHRMFDAQVRLVRDTYGINPGEVDLPMLPIFALFNPALGMTTVVPELDPSRPAAVDPVKIVQAIRQEQVTNSFGSPTLWRKISRFCQQHNLVLPSVRRVLMAGAPVSPGLFADVQTILPNGMAHSPYGATEALPLCTISAEEVLGRQSSKHQTPDAKIQSTDSAALFGLWPLEFGTSAATAAGHGTCVGRPVREIEVKIIAITDAPIATLAEARELPSGQIGEIVVRGPVVTREYDQLPEETALAKIQTPKAKLQTISTPGPASSGFGACDLALGVSAPAGAVWHRLGDVGYLDAAGRLWYCGRKAERVETSHGTFFTEQVEPVFNAHPAVARMALVGVGHDGRRPAIVVEPVSRAILATASLRQKLVRELRALGATHPHTDLISLVYFHPHFPVDVRHNAKIHRLKLAAWARSQSGYEMDRGEVPAQALER